MWFHPDHGLHYSGVCADVWSADDREYLNVNANDGNVYHTDNSANGHSVRLLNTIMHLEDIFQAYFDCRRRKRWTPEALLFEEHYEKHCIQLYQEIITPNPLQNSGEFSRGRGNYKPDPYKLIYVTDPVMREIFVPTFRDRVVHHLLANWLRPKLERLFIHDNYAGREGRGTLFGIRRAKKFMRQVTHNYQKPAYVLKLDIASYFRSIPKERLFSVILGQVNSFAKQGMNTTRGSRGIATQSVPDISKQIEDISFHLDSGSRISLLRNGNTRPEGRETEGWENSERERERVLIDLLKKIIFHDARTHFSGTIHPVFPKHKSLFSTGPDRGLPLGDLVSQMLGNFYLHELDHFVKHTLKIKQYGRYMDDMILFHSDREVLENAIEQIRDFLHNTLGLELHEGKIVLNSCVQGILFLGAYIKPWRTYIGNRTKKNMYECISTIDPEKFEAQMISYMGIMGHFDTVRLRRRVDSFLHIGEMK